MKKVRVGLVGCGRYAEAHLQAFRSVRSGEAVALFDPDRARAEKLAALYDIPRVSNSLEELCSLPDIQAVDVLTPEHLHLEPVLEALAAGKHVLVEKPMATDAADGQTMIDAAKAAGKSLMVGHIVRFETKYAMMKDALSAGKLGTIVSMHARRNRPKALLERYDRVHPCLETGIHDIDLLLWYAGRPVRRVRGYERSALGRRVPDTFWGILEFEGGAIGVVETMWLLPAVSGVVLDDQLQVVGDQGIGTLNLLPGPLTFWREGALPEIADVSYDPVVGGASRGALREELEYFCSCVHDGREPEVSTPREARRAVRVAQALIQSAALERDVKIGDWD
jgi:predicted dehydrogenase